VQHPHTRSDDTSTKSTADATAGVAAAARGGGGSKQQLLQQQQLKQSNSHSRIKSWLTVLMMAAILHNWYNKLPGQS